MTLTRLNYPLIRLGPPRRFAGAAAILLIAGCAAGPDYHRPEVATPAAYKETAGWKPAAPADASPRGPWWNDFADPLLSDLELQVSSANQTLKQAEANYEQARQLARADRATLLPFVSVAGSVQRARTPALPGATTTYSASLQGSWEPDFWVRIRRTSEASVATAQAGAADLALTRLSLQASLAQNYVALRTLEERARLLDDGVAAYRRTLTISQNRYHAGVAARSDLASAQAQLDNAQAQRIDVGVQRARMEHAIAVLVGKAPAEVSIPASARLAVALPEIPPQVPSALLERRPDVAEAERQVAAANARVGVQTAAWFPAITLTGADGYAGSPLRELVTAPNRFWSLGGQVAETLLDWGQRGAAVGASRAAYDASVANYRQVVLGALQEVEDDLATLRILGEEAAMQEAAVGEAAEAARIALNEYNAGTVDYTTVAIAQVVELNSRLAALTILSNRLAASVDLIRALGGGWSTADLPDARGVLSGQSDDRPSPR